MAQMMAMAMSTDILVKYDNRDSICAELTDFGLQGIEGVWAMEPVPEDYLKDLVIGYHLTLFSDWLDLYREDSKALVENLGA